MLYCHRAGDRCIPHCMPLEKAGNLGIKLHANPVSILWKRFTGSVIRVENEQGRVFYLDRKDAENWLKRHQSSNIDNTGINILEAIRNVQKESIVLFASPFDWKKSFTPENLNEKLENTRKRCESSMQASANFVPFYKKAFEECNRSLNELRQEEGQQDFYTFLGDCALSENREFANFSAGYYTAVGRRLSVGTLDVHEDNEDAHLLKHADLHIERLGTLKVIFAAIFDGHGGRDYAEYVSLSYDKVFQDELNQELGSLSAKQKRSVRAIWRDALERDAAIANALKSTNVVLHMSLKSDLDIISGTAVCANLILEGKVYTAGAGDSKTVAIHKDGSVRQLTWDHEINKESISSIEKRGGILNERGTRLLNSQGFGLNMSRAVGDHDFLGINPRPSIQIISLEGVEYIIVACDGLWDVCTPELAQRAIQEALIYNPYLTCEELAQYLVLRAGFAGSADNISVIVLKYL